MQMEGLKPTVKAIGAQVGGTTAFISQTLKELRPYLKAPGESKRSSKRNETQPKYFDRNVSANSLEFWRETLTLLEIAREKKHAFLTQRARRPPAVTSSGLTPGTGTVCAARFARRGLRGAVCAGRFARRT
jgi:hypothetical protein